MRKLFPFSMALILLSANSIEAICAEKLPLNESKKIYSQDEVSSIVAQQSRLEALQMLGLIDAINRGDVKSACTFAEQSLKTNELIIGHNGLMVSSSLDKGENRFVSTKIRNYFQSGKGCGLGKKGK